MKTKIGKEILFGLIFVWGFLSVCVMAGEDIPGQPMSDLKFFGSKIAGIVSFWLCFRTGRRWERKGILPKIKKED